MQKLLQSVAAMFRPPFEGLPAVIWLYFVWCFLALPHSPFLDGQFRDPDNYMYLAHILDWLKGQSWFDITQYRLNPPDGVPMHFSRLTELPIAGLIFLFRQFNLDWTVAVITAALVWPPVLFAALLATLRWLAKSFMPHNWVNLTAFITLFATSISFKFSFGAVDHHNMAILMTALALACVIRMMDKPEEARWALGAGLFTAFSMAVALETLPWVLVLMGWIGLWMIQKGRSAARSGLLSGLIFYLVSASLLFLLKPYGSWLEADPLMYSSVYVLLAGSIATCFSGIALASQTRFFAARLLVGIFLGSIAVFFFFRLFPELIHGPYGAISKDLSQIFLRRISEAQPIVPTDNNVLSSFLGFLTLLFGFASCLFMFMHKESKFGWPWLLALLSILMFISGFFPNMAMPFLGFAACLYIILSTENKNVRSWALMLVLLFASILLAGFYQVRFSAYMQLFSIVPLAEFLRRSLAEARVSLRGRTLAAAELGFILLVGPLPTILFPAMVDGRSFNKGILMFPSNIDAHGRCNSSSLQAFLDGPRFRDKAPRLIMNLPDDGPKLLFYTNHKVLSASYHMNVGGNLSSNQFFTTTNPDEAKRVAEDRQVDMVVLCRSLPSTYRSKEGPFTFAERLARGDIPDWLARTGLAPSDNYMVFNVKK